MQVFLQLEFILQLDTVLLISAILVMDCCTGLLSISSLSVAIRNVEICIQIHSNFCSLEVKIWESNVRLVFLNKFDYFNTFLDCCNGGFDFKPVFRDLIVHNWLFIV